MASANRLSLLASGIALTLLSIGFGFGCSVGSGSGTDQTGTDGGPGGGTPDAAAGGDVTPMMIPGGGVASGAIDGEVNVYAIDVETGAPIAGASVLVAPAGSDNPLSGQTDASGLAEIQGNIAGPQSITVSASGYAAATWVGVNGANVTITMEPRPRRPIRHATVRGSIDGWSSLPPPDITSYNVAIVLYSFSPTFGARENAIEQPTNRDQPANVCVWTSFDNSPCTWEMRVRPGKQIHYAVIARGNQNGTPLDTSDDTYELIGYAAKTGLDVSPGQTINNEVLTLLPASALIDINAAVPAGPAGLSDAVGLPFLDMGQWGQLTFPLPTLDQRNGRTKIIAQEGEFSAGEYMMVGLAVPAPEVEHPYSASFKRSVDFSATVSLSPWLSVPSSISSGGGAYSFAPASGAALHTVTLFEGTNIVWTVVLLDGSSSFRLPQLSPSPISGGRVDMLVSALDWPGFSAGGFRFEQLNHQMARASEAKSSVAVQ